MLNYSQRSRGGDGMDYTATERSGRFYLRSLLCVIFILMAV